MKNILVPCDFSKPAVSAFRFALDIAAQSRGTVHLLNVIELPVLHDTVIMPVLSFEQAFFQELNAKSKDEMEKLEQNYNAANQDVVKEIKFGPVHYTILNYINDNRIDLVVMGTHGATGLKEFLTGSNAEKIVRTSPVPVIALKDFYKGPIKNIVFPNTLETENQEELVMKVKELQHFFQATLHIVWINTPLNFESDLVTRKRLQDFANRFMLKDYAIHVFNHPDSEMGILHFTEMINGDMIAMGTHGRKGLAHVLKGSLAEDIVNHLNSLIWTCVIKQDKPTAVA